MGRKFQKILLFRLLKSQKPLNILKNLTLSLATSGAKFAPIRTAASMPRVSLMSSEIRRSFELVDLPESPFMRLTATALLLTFPFN